MTSRDNDLQRENDMLRRRTSQVSAAILRINTSLDPDTVLREAREERPPVDRRPVQRDHDHRRSGTAAGLRHLRLHRRRAPELGGLARPDRGCSTTCATFRPR